MKYVSTRGHASGQAFTDILLEGLAADGGLAVPEQWPRITRPKLDAMRDYIDWEKLLVAAGTGSAGHGTTMKERRP